MSTDWDMAQLPHVGVGIIIKKGSQVLLLRRKNVHGEGTWSTPGGHLDLFETPEACAMREAKEESNLDLQAVEFVAVTNDVFEAENKHYITMWMEAEYSGGEARLNAPNESDRIAWFSWDKLPQPLFIPLQHLLAGQCYPAQSIAERFGIRRK